MTPLAPSPDTQQNSAFSIPFDLHIENCEKTPLRCNVTMPCGDEHNYLRCFSLVTICGKSIKKLIFFYSQSSQLQYKTSPMHLASYCMDANICIVKKPDTENSAMILPKKFYKKLPSHLVHLDNLSPVGSSSKVILKRSCQT